jgi:simple sugar transport system permease protein
MIGISGAFLSIAQASSFGEDMTSGRGFIAMAVVILGKWSPLGVMAGALLFGAASALQMLFQLTDIAVPRNIIMMVPYIATVIAVLLVSRHRVGAPRALGVPYEKS